MSGPHRPPIKPQSSSSSCGLAILAASNMTGQRPESLVGICRPASAGVLSAQGCVVTDGTLSGHHFSSQPRAWASMERSKTKGIPSALYFLAVSTSPLARIAGSCKYLSAGSLITKAQCIPAYGTQGADAVLFPLTASINFCFAIKQLLS